MGQSHLAIIVPKKTIKALSLTTVNTTQQFFVKSEFFVRHLLGKEIFVINIVCAAGTLEIMSLESCFISMTVMVL